MTRRYHHGDVPAEAVRVVEGMVDEGGAEAVTVRKVAAQLGVSHAALYRHFVDIEAVLDVAAARLLTRIVEAVPAGATPRELLEAYCRVALDAPHRYRLAFELAASERAPLSAAELRALRDRAGQVFSGGSPVTRDVVDAVLRAWGTAHGLLDLHWRGLVPGRGEALVAYVVEAALR